MDLILEMLSRGVDQLLGRASGPLHLRLFIMPTVVAILATGAGLKDAREGHLPFIQSLLAHSSDRRRLFRSLRQHFVRVFIVALVLDTVYQIMVLRTFYPVQALIVAVVLAVVPYFLIRGPAARLANWFIHRTTRAPRLKGDHDGEPPRSAG